MAFNGRFVLNIAYYAAQQGVKLDALIAASGKTKAELEEESCKVEDQSYNTVLEKAVTGTGDHFLGLHVGESQNLSALGLIGQITQTSETVKQALEFCCQFANLGCSALPMGLVEEKEHYKVTLTPNPLWEQQSPIALRHTAEGVLVFTIREFHSLTRKNYKPIAIHVPWKQPLNSSEYQRVFACPINFNKEEIAILFQKKHVEEPVITSNFDLLRVLVAHAEEKSAQIRQKEGFMALVKQSVVGLIKPEFPTIDQVASHLNVSLRTFQRRLKEEGYTFKQVIDELRKDFAISYLRRPDLSITEIAYLLNYSDSSTFARSFKRWTGQSPNGYREKLNA